MEIQQHDGVVVEVAGISAGLRQAQREGEERDSHHKLFSLAGSPPKHRRDHHRHRRDTLISIVASLSLRHLLLLRLSLPLRDKVKQLQGVCISYNKVTTIWLLPVADNFGYKT